MCLCMILRLFVGCSAVLAHFILDEKLRWVGVLGCGLCIVGSTMIILHAPQERTPSSVEQIWNLATQPCMLSCSLHEAYLLAIALNLCLDLFCHFVIAAFLCYAAIAVAVSLFLMLYCSPRYGQMNIIVYVGICSVIGSLTVNIVHVFPFDIFYFILFVT
jgi:magnesium transporter